MGQITRPFRQVMVSARVWPKFHKLDGLQDGDLASFKVREAASEAAR
jgi:hypothetical protein